MGYWLLKTEPESYAYSSLEQLGRDKWDGVRNFSALNYMKQIEPGDKIFIYHTGKEKAIVGVAEAVSTAYPDPGEQDPRFKVFDLVPRYRLQRPVTLKEIKEDPFFNEWQLVHKPRLSVMPVLKKHWDLIHRLAQSTAWQETASREFDLSLR